MPAPGSNDPAVGDDLRRAVLEEMLAEAAFDGWTDAALKRAAGLAGMSREALARGDLDLLFPRGVGDVIDFWAEEEDRAMAEAYDSLDEKPKGVTGKIRWLVQQRIAGLDWNREAARRAAATLALPPLTPLGPRLVWRTADAMWRTIGDTSTDGNHYSKRATLSGVYLSTLTRWFGDEGKGPAADPYEETWAFLDKRLEGVGQVEKMKARVTKVLPDPAAIVGTLGRLRYGKN